MTDFKIFSIKIVMENKGILEKINIPELPGVYIFKDSSDEIIYIGKAKNLSKRVSSYFNNSEKDRKTLMLVRKIHNIEYFITENEVEALLLENNLIKQYQPKYNIRLKDAKTFPMIKITKENLPRVVKCREKNNNINEYFGPYANVKEVNTLLTIFKKVFKIRSCNKKFKPPYNFTPCLYYHIKICDAPCASKITEEEYNKNISMVREILKGNIESVVNILTEKMLSFSENLMFEHAAIIRDQINLIKSINSFSTVHSNDNDCNDYIGLYNDYNYAAISVVKKKEGKVIGKESFILSNFMEEDRILENFISTYYLNLSEFPANIYIQKNIDDDEKEMIKNAIEKKYNFKVNIDMPANNLDKKLLRLAIENAEIYFEERLHRLETLDSLKELQKVLALEKIPKTIECIDIATLDGKFNTASLVSLKDGKPDKKNYRQFNIKGKGHPDDYSMMKEVIERRYKRLKEENKDMPDLIIVDGGPGQVAVSKEILDKLGLDIPLIGIAKKEETIFFPDKREPLKLPAKSKALKIVQLARDEAHRFSNSRFKNRYKNSLLQTELSKIEGIGKKRINILLKEFKSIENIKNASIEEISNIKDIGYHLAKKIYDYFHR